MLEGELAVSAGDLARKRGPRDRAARPGREAQVAGPCASDLAREGSTRADGLLSGRRPARGTNPGRECTTKPNSTFLKLNLHNAVPRAVWNNNTKAAAIISESTSGAGEGINIEEGVIIAHVDPVNLATDTVCLKNNMLEHAGQKAG